MNKKTIIIIDDDAEDCFLIGSLIEQEYPDYRVVSITNHLQAVEELTQQAHLPSFLLVDLNMPQKNGLEILSDLQTLPRYRQVPIAVMTGALNPQLTTQFATLNVVDYVEKTGNYANMLSTLNRVLRAPHE